jgi:predicted metalloprotease with PDZ domain
VSGVRSGYGWRRLLSSHNNTGLHLEFSWLLKPNADHYPFFEHDIPVLMLHTGLHDQYHRPSDVAKLVNTEGITQITRMLFGMIYELADGSAAAPAFRAAAQYETPETEKAVFEQAAQNAKPADRLGVRWIEDAALSGGIRISDIIIGSPADRAGLRVDDRIVQFAGRKILCDDDFFGAVAMADHATMATIQRPGEEKLREIKFELPGNALRWGILWRVDDAEPGVIILSHVVPGSPAAWAGLQSGDRIYQVAGRDFADEAAFALLAKTLPVPLQLLVERNGQLRIVVLQIPKAESVKRAA